PDRLTRETGEHGGIDTLAADVADQDGEVVGIAVHVVEIAPDAQPLRPWPVPRGYAHSRVLGQLRWPKRLLHRLRQLSAFLIQPGRFDSGGHPERELLGGDHVTVRVAAATVPDHHEYPVGRASDVEGHSQC